MITSMTGFGKAESKVNGYKFTVEIKSVNSKFFEVSLRAPLTIQEKENEVKEIISKKISRGKINCVFMVDKDSKEVPNLLVQKETLRSYLNLITEIKNETGIREEVKLDHLLRFSEILKPDSDEGLREHWNEIKRVIENAVNDLLKMKLVEGKSLEKDIGQRIHTISSNLKKCFTLSAQNIKSNKAKLRKKIKDLIDGKFNIDSNRIEVEILMMVDKLDISEEITRASSHVAYFKNNMKSKEQSGRRLNFLIQEMNREINTIASKSNHAKISQLVVEMKEELEKVREQLQNIE